MPYVKRDGANKVDGLFRHPVTGQATEFLSDNDAEVLAFLTDTPITDVDKADYKLTTDPAWKGFIARQAKKEGVSTATLESEIKAEL